MLIKVILTGHITSQSCQLSFYGGDLVSLITFEGTILYQAVPCFSGKECKGVNRNGKIKPNDVVANAPLTPNEDCRATGCNSGNCHLSLVVAHSPLVVATVRPTLS